MIVRVSHQPTHMSGFFDDILAGPKQELANTATAVANQAIASGVARAQAAIDQTSKRTIKNAIVGALFVAAIIGAAHVAWSYANAQK